MSHDVKFGSAFAVDGFGFVGRGSLAADDDCVVLSGKRHSPAAIRILVVGAFLILAVAVGLSLLLMACVGMVVAHYCCVTPGQVAIGRDSIGNVVRRKNEIRFDGKEPEHNKTRRSVFSATSREAAEEIEQLVAGV